MTTLKDVARESGLTVTTVSRVLNNRGYISDDARRRVREAMEKLNYHPNEAARSLQKKMTNTIGVVVPSIRHPYFTSMVNEIESYAYTRGYKILLCNSQNIKAREKEFLDVCTLNRAAGIILLSGSIAVEDLSGTDLPVITLERYVDCGTAAVECDNRAGGELAAACLIDNGCRHLAIIGITSDHLIMPADLRSEGFRNVCKDRGVSLTEVFTSQKDFEQMEYRAYISRLLEDHPEVDGILACSDVIAAQTLQVCHKMGIDVPGRIKLIAFDDTMLAQWLVPKLTVIHQPIREMAQLAVTYLDEAAKGQVVPERTILPVGVIRRDSL